MARRQLRHLTKDESAFYSQQSEYGLICPCCGAQTFNVIVQPPYFVGQKPPMMAECTNRDCDSDPLTIDLYEWLARYAPDQEGK